MGRYNSYNIYFTSSTTSTTDIIEIKLVMIGDSSVGKTSIVTRLVFDKFKTDNTSTIGGAFNVLTKKTSNNEVFKFQIWDTAGQDRFRSLVPMYVQRCNLVFFVFDITFLDSFNAIKNYWYKFVTSIEPNTEIILIGNKSDLESKRQVLNSDAEEYAEHIGVPYLECSAMNISNMDELEALMITAAQKIKKRKSGNNNDNNDNNDNNNNNNNININNNVVDTIEINEDKTVDRIYCTGARCYI
jgi:small GTP-binding protein